MVSGIIDVLQSGCRWPDCPPAYGPPTTIHNRFNRWSRKKLWQKIFATLAAGAALSELGLSASTAIKALRGRTTKIHALTDVRGRPGCGHVG